MLQEVPKDVEEQIKKVTKEYVKLMTSFKEGDSYSDLRVKAQEFLETKMKPFMFYTTLVQKYMDKYMKEALSKGE